MLLDGFASTWFYGVKQTLITWKEATELLRTTFGPKKPPYRVYKELFSSEQDVKTPSDVFICRARSLLAHLPKDTLVETMQIDIVYGLLHKRVREKIPHDKIKTFTELLEQTRLIEESFEDLRTSDQHKDVTKKQQCTCCRNLGHTKEECRKLASKQARCPEDAAPAFKAAASQPATTASPIISCYGCGKPWYVRSNCPKCISEKTATSALDFCVVDTMREYPTAPRSHPVLNIKKTLKCSDLMEPELWILRQSKALQDTHFTNCLRKTDIVLTNEH